MSGALGFINYVTKAFTWVSSNDPLPVTLVASTDTDPVVVAGANGTGAATPANPLPVNAPGSGGASVPYADQQVVTASAVALTTQALSNGVTIKAKSTNLGKVFVGGAAVTATDDGTGNGFALMAGEAISLPVSTTAGIYIIGTLNDVVYVMGS